MEGNMKRVAIVDHVGKKAGMDYYSSSLAKGFTDNSIDCYVFSNFEGIDAEKTQYVPVYDGHTTNNAASKLFHFVKATIQSAYQAKQAQVDLVIVHLFSANIVTLLLLLIPKLMGLKVAVVSHDVSSFVGEDNQRLQNIIYNRLADYIIVHNQYSYQTLLKSIQIQDKDKVLVIKHGGYLDHIGKPLNKSIAREKLGLDIEGKYLLFFGQIKDVKGLDILLEAMESVPKDIQLIIAGKPWKADFSIYDEIIETKGLSNRVIKMIRFIEDQERELLFFAADVNVLPYRVIYQSGVLLMAMSHGLPVIASDLPANKEIIQDGKNGFLFKSENVKGLAKTIDCFFHDEEKRKNIALKALETIKEDYSWKKIAGEYIKGMGAS